MELGCGDGASDRPANFEKCEDNCNKLLFSDLCAKFDSIEKTTGQRKSKAGLIFTPELAAVVQGQSVFPLVRLLLPLYDSERGRYGLKQATVSKTYVEALQLNRSSTDAQRLLHWKDQSKSQFLQASGATGGGDFSSILEDVLKSRVREDPSTATLGDINTLLDNLAEAYGESGKVDFIRQNVLNKFNPREQKWLMRIIFQDLKIGLKLESVLGMLSPWAAQCFAESTDLRLICEGGRGKKRPMGLRPHTAFAPMLAKGFPNTGQLVEVERAMGGNPFVMDVKLDGERMLCHFIEGSGCRLITRNGNDYTAKYQVLAADLGNKLRGCRSYILDGEVCAWDPTAEQFVAFGSNRGVGNMERAAGAAAADRDDGAAASARLVYIVFDVVYAEGAAIASDMDKILRSYAQEELNARRAIADKDWMMKSDLEPTGGELTQLPLYARRGFLRERLVVVPNRLIHIDHRLVVETDTGERRLKLESFFNEMMVKGEEGLVVKDWTSPYELGEKSRSKDAKWIKMKPEYSNNMTDLDLIILGGYYGEGRGGVRSEGISHFLLGVKDIANSTENSVKYMTVGKVGTGYTYAELKELREKLNPHWQQWPLAAGTKAAAQPTHLTPWTKIKRDDIPHVWIPPEESCILEVKCAEITPSENFSIGLTLRFPRVAKIRYDKEISGVMTCAEFREAQSRDRTMRPEAAGAEASEGGAGNKPSRQKRGRAVAGVEDGGGETAKKRSAVPSGASYVVNVVGNSMLEKKSEVFAGKVFCILENTFHVPVGLFETSRMLSAKEFVELVCSYGGTVVANPIEDSLVVCGSKRTMPIQNIIKSKKRDVLDFMYIVECMIANELLPIKTRHYVGLSAESTKALVGGSDIFGDSFTDLVSGSDVSQLFRDMAYAMDGLSGADCSMKAGQVPLSMNDFKNHPQYKKTELYYRQLRERG